MASPTTEFSREQFLEKPLPSSPESERVILGAILLDNTLISQAIELLNQDDFYSPLHRRVFRAMSNLFERSDKIDPILIGEELRKEGQLENIGGVATITNLTYGLPHFSNIAHYAKIVHDKAVIRNLIKVCNQVVSEALSEEEDAEVVLDHAEQAIFALADERTRQGFSHIKPVAETVLAKVQEYARRESHALTGLSTGFRDLDQMTSGLQQTDLIIVAARPSMGKCLAASAEIVGIDGSVQTIEQIFKRKQTELLTLGNDFKFTQTNASDFVDDGIKPVFRVTTKLGREVETTITHPFLTINGWQKLENVKAGTKIAVPRVINVFGQNDWRECEVKILGYLLGDGCLTKKTPEFTVGKTALREDFTASVNQFGGIEAVQSNTENRTFSFRIRKTGGLRSGENPLTVWLKTLGVFGCNSHTKFIPSEVFTLKKEFLAVFLNRLFATDGWACILKSGQVQLGFASVSERMIRQIQHLLLRFGVIAGLKKRAGKYKDERRTAWQLDITDALSIKKFISEIGIFGKEARLTEILRILENKKYQTNKDLIPVEIWQHISVVKGTESWSSLARRSEIEGYTNLHAGKRSPSRERLQKIAGSLDDKFLRNLAESEIYWDEIVSIEYAGNKQVYDLTIPETHNFVANDICVHNTALCLTLAQNAATLENAVVAVFSLEMSKEQLVMRMLSSEARVDAHRFRSGFLTRDEWGRLAEAIGTLSEAKIFIDDTAGISVLEMRAKTRRLIAEQKKLDLIVVDYLQLMSGSRRTESRQQEVSAISRELKGLAKELGVPVVALSQLSRAPEARNPPKPMMSDLRESGCLTGDSLVTLADTGERVPIRELVGKTGFRIWALNENTWSLEKAVVTNSFSTGVKPVFRLKTKLGREIRATGNHKFYSFVGWKRLDELEIGERLAVPREIKSPKTQTMSNDELALLAHLIGDGCTLPRHAIQYTTREPDLAETVAVLAGKVFGDEVKPKIKQERTWYQVYLSSTRHHTHNIRSAVNVSRDRAFRIARAVDSNTIRNLAESDIYWDEIVSIEFEGEEEVFDLTVSDLHNFTVNNIIVHNSIEQDADVVAFIYRDDYYKPTDENAGIAEIIISKQRNGPTGTIKLAFLKEFTRFENYFGE